MSRNASFDKQRIVDSEIIVDCLYCKHWHIDKNSSYYDDESYCKVLKNGNCPYPIRDISKFKDNLEIIECCGTCKYYSCYLYGKCSLNHVKVESFNKCESFKTEGDISAK